MLKIDPTNLMADAVGDENGLTSADLAAIEKTAGAAHEKFMQWRRTQDAIFYDIVFDPLLLDGIAEAAKDVASRFDELVVLGIGGSALGLRCAAQALLPPFWNLKNKEQRNGRPRLFVCDNIDPESFAGLLDLVDIKRTCFTVISKSGMTTETAAQFIIVLERLKRAVGERWREHLIIITDPERGELRPLVQKEKLRSFAIPPKLGGRFSVLSAVGLFPAACAGIDATGLVSGARAMAERCSGSALEGNPAYQLGAYKHFLDWKKKKTISVMVPYSDALMLASDWYAQLWAESLGKQGHGQTPVKALGATDQHSQVQLYMEGPRDKVFTFVGVESFRVAADAARVSGAAEAFKYIEGKDLGAILRAEQ
ncbi:MAG: glucose-6-phosphate isomerase, partial [bacterium]